MSNFSSFREFSDQGRIYEVLNKLRDLELSAGASLGFRPALFASDIKALSNLEGSKLDQIIRSLIILEDTMTEFASPEDGGLSADGEVACLRRALWKYGLHSKFELEDYISEGDVIEVYTSENVQVYRNLVFFRLCTYSLLEIMTREWYELYERPEFVTVKLMAQIREALENELPVVPKIPTHIMVEKISDERRRFLTRFKGFLPLHDAAGKCCAFIVVINAEIFDEKGIHRDQKFSEPGYVI